MKSYSEDTPAGVHDAGFDHDSHPEQSRHTGFIAQLPVIIVTAALIIGAMAWMRDKDAIQRASDLEPLRAQNEALRVQGEENRRQIEATTKMLKDALARHDGEVFRTDEEIQKLNDDRVSLLADAVAKKVVPALPPLKSAAELEQLQQEQVDKVASRLTDNLRPVLSGISADQKAASAQVVQQYESRVQRLDQNLQVSQAAAQDALKLAHEVSARYLDSFNDQSALVRVVALPANLLMDTAKLNLVTNRDRAKVDAELSAKMKEIDQRLHAIQAAGPIDNKS
jgi:hypothetical protein